jgi:Fe-S-cluster-containing hydrogenase component 2
LLKKTGVPSKEELMPAFPSEERMKEGPVAIIECFQNIPCNPCATSCPQDAIRDFIDINDIPVFVAEDCNGCALCVANCPGLAIFVLDETFSETETLVKLPYEFQPLPTQGEVVDVVDRGGETVGQGRVHRVQNPKSFDKTAVVWIVVPRALGRDVRFIRRKGD